MRAYAGRELHLYGVTALQFLGVDLPSSLEDWQTFHVLTPTDQYRPERRGVVSHRSVRASSTWRTRQGVRLLHPVDHWLQLTRASDAELVQVGDAILRRRDPLVTLGDFERRLAESDGTQGIRRARRLAKLVVPQTGSLAETRTRLTLIDGGLPCPLVNPPVFCRSVGRTFHVDMGYVEERVGVEYDGVVHVGNRHQMEIDAIRRRALQEEGWLIITVTADQLRYPTEVVRSVEAALVMRRAAVGRSTGEGTVIWRSPVR
jgi:hypothetical protein